MGDAVRVERSGRGGVVAHVVLDRPQAHNAFDASTIALLHQVFAASRDTADERGGAGGVARVP